MARPASLDELISTKPKPRERPVSRSVTTVADSHVPTCANSDSSSALVVEKDRFPTKIFLPMALSCPFPGRLWFRSQLPEREVEIAAGATGELLLHPGEASHGARRDGHLELRPSTHPQRILGDRLGGVRGEPPRPLECAGRPSHGGRDAHPEAERSLRSARLRLAARADE